MQSCWHCQGHRKVLLQQKTPKIYSLKGKNEILAARIKSCYTADPFLCLLDIPRTEPGRFWKIFLNWDCFERRTSTESELFASFVCLGSTLPTFSGKAFYIRTLVTRTVKGNEKQFELEGNTSRRGKFQGNFDRKKGKFSSI